MEQSAIGTPPAKQGKQRGWLQGLVLLLFLALAAAGNMLMVQAGARRQRQQHLLHDSNSSSMTLAAAAAFPRRRTALGPTTDARMVPQPPFSRGCFPKGQVPNSRRDAEPEWGCPIIDCSLDPACSVTNTSCCAFFNLEMLDFLDRFLTANCLQHEWMLAHGTILGAVRDKGIIPFTEDIDVALTPLAIQFLELNSTKEAMWRHGYSFWADVQRGIWKVCAHLHHPSPHFQELMVTGLTGAQYYHRYHRKVAGYLDGWLMWQVPDATQRCSETDISDSSLAAALATPWDGDRAALSAGVDVCSLATEAASRPARWSARLLRNGDETAVTQETYCMKESDAPHVLQLGLREGDIADKAFPIPFNLVHVMESNYGPSWRLPKPGFHGNPAPAGVEPKLRAALVEKLSVTVWGDTPWQARKKACGLDPKSSP